ncbi:MAG: hypothetical protein WBA10_20845, partial [Elainellaceae cyanobacterium]
MNDNARQSKSLISVQTVVILSVLWGVVSLVVFLLGSPIEPRPQWYGVATYALENLAFLGAALLCLRNWGSSQIVSGRGVWLLFAIGMLSYFAGNLILGWWELVWNLSPDVSPADFFYLLTYLVLGIGMLLAVVSKRLSLTAIQYVIVAAIAVVGIALAYFVSYGGADNSSGLPPSIEPQVQVSRVLLPAAIALEPPTSRAVWLAQAPPTTTPTEAAPTEAAPTPPTAPAPQPAAADVTPQPQSVTEDTSARDTPPPSAPDWVTELNSSLEPYAGPVGLLYIAGDVFLLVMAT